MHLHGQPSIEHEQSYLNALAEAGHALAAIGSNLEGLEIGNEVDLYPGSVRPVDRTEADYVQE